MSNEPRHPPLRPVPAKPSPVKVSADTQLREAIEAIITAMNAKPTLRERKDLQDDAKRAVFSYFADKEAERK